MSEASAAARSAEPTGMSEAEWALRQDLADAFRLNVACEVQLKILAANQKVLIPPPEVCQRHYDACFGSDWRADGSMEWPGLRRLLDAEDTSYAS